MKSVDIKFYIENPCFRELFVWVKWDFPFLPRVGESVNPWILIKNLDLSKTKEKITKTGEESFNSFKQFGNDDFEGWLYDVCCESDCVSSITYSCEYEKNDISLFIVLKDKP